MKGGHHATAVAQVTIELLSSTPTPTLLSRRQYRTPNGVEFPRLDYVRSDVKSAKHKWYSDDTMVVKNVKW